MLGKLLKYEFKATARTFFPLYLAVLVVSILNTILYAFAPDWTAMEIIRAMMTLLYVLLIIAVFVLTFVVIIQRFYKNLLGDEGYLSMTLPVSITSHLVSKLIAAVVWFIGTIAITFASIFIMVRDVTAMRDFFNAVMSADASVQQAVGMSLPALITAIIILAFISLITSILSIYTSISFGQLSDRHKVASSFGAYLVIYMISQVVSSVILIIMSSIFFQDWSVSGMAITVAGSEISAVMPSGFVPAYLCVFGLQEITFMCAYFFVSRFLLKRKLNLQ